MAQFYKVLKADPLGEPYTPNFEGAKATQTYWCQLEGVDNDVSIGKQVPNTVTPGEQVYGDLMYAKSQKGTEYWKFKSQKVPDGTPRPASTPAQAQAQQATGVDMSGTIPGWFLPYGNMIQYVFDEMKKMNSAEEGNVKLSDVPLEENADEETKALVADIFGDGTPEES